MQRNQKYDSNSGFSCEFNEISELLSYGGLNPIHTVFCGYSFMGEAEKVGQFNLPTEFPYYLSSRKDIW